MRELTLGELMGEMDDMTIGKLIDILKQYDQSMPVRCGSYRIKTVTRYPDYVSIY